MSVVASDVTPSRNVAMLEVPALDKLFEALRDTGYRVIGPTLRDGAIILAELRDGSELPFGWGVQLAPGRYRLHRREDDAAFGHSAGPQSWKQFLHPPRELLWSAHRTGESIEIDASDPAAAPQKLAFVGVRPCDLRAIQIQDKVLGGDPRESRYAARREAAFIVAVNCTEPGETCFCDSMDTGPQAGPGYDLALTELTELTESTGDRRHSFVVEVGSDAGAAILAQIPHAAAEPAAEAAARAAVARARDRMGRAMRADDLRELMADSMDAARWDDVATRCLTCGNCTMACPTCFCTTVEDVTDLGGDHAERWTSWDSCFDLDFSYLHGGPVRSTPKSRYRQWLTHKLGTWHDQFGSSGCVGCGRCIVWCPVGIDLTEEVAALREEVRLVAAGSSAPDEDRPG
jgi:ferredoxin